MQLKRLIDKPKKIETRKYFNFLALEDSLAKLSLESLQTTLLQASICFSLNQSLKSNQIETKEEIPKVVLPRKISRNGSESLQLGNRRRTQQGKCCF